MKIICAGRNYVKHIEELKNEMPVQPAIFLKPETAILTSGNTFVIPGFSKEIHYETELVFKIGEKAKNISEEDAVNILSAMTVGIDFTARDVQDFLKQKQLSWELSKAFDQSAVIGNFVRMPSVKDLQDIRFSLNINDKEVQSGWSGNMIFPVVKLVSFVSKYFTLEPGDLVFTGTPEGVGPVKSGDLLTAFIENKPLLELRIA